MIKGLKKVGELAIQISGGRTFQTGGGNSFCKGRQMVACQVCLRQSKQARAEQLQQRQPGMEELEVRSEIRGPLPIGRGAQ